MEKQNQENPVIEEKNIREWVARDISSAVSLLNMIRLDPDLLYAVQEKIIEKTKALDAQKRSEAKNKED